MLSPGKPVLVKIRNSTVSLYVMPHDYGISRDLYYYGAREENACREYLRHIQPGQTVIEVGANIGYYTCLLAEKMQGRGRLFAIEPDDRNLELLKLNLRQNKMDHWVSVHSCAISNQAGEATLHIAAKSNLNTLVKTGEHAAVNQYLGEKKISIITLDDFLDQQGVPHGDVGAIRMDIEGHEYEVFEGMKKTLAASANLILFLEIHADLITAARGRDGYHAFIDRLEGDGLEICAAMAHVTSGRDAMLDSITYGDLKNEQGCIMVILRKRAGEA